MRQIATEVVIEAAPRRVWEIITDLAHYSEWNPFIVEASGTVREGERIHIRTRFEKRGAMQFDPRVIRSDEPRELVWRGTLFGRRLMQGEHRFFLEQEGPERTRLHHSERFEGLLMPLIWSGMRKPTEAAFQAMNAALKARAEGRRGSPPG